MINRRKFIGAATAASTALLPAQQGYEWGGPVLDIHLHLRPDAESNFAHMEGSGVTQAVLLTPLPAVERARAEVERHAAVLRGSSACPVTGVFLTTKSFASAW